MHEQCHDNAHHGSAGQSLQNEFADKRGSCRGRSQGDADTETGRVDRGEGEDGQVAVESRTVAEGVGQVQGHDLQRHVYGSVKSNSNRELHKYQNIECHTAEHKIRASLV